MHDPNVLSDHCLIECVIQLNQRDFNVNENNDTLVQECDVDNYEYVSRKYVWDQEKKTEFLEKLQLPECELKISELINDFSNSTVTDDIDRCIQSFENLFEDVSSMCIKITSNASHADQEYQTEKNLPWYNEDCFEHKVIFRRMLNKYRELPNDENRLRMVEARSKYKNVLRKYRYEYDREKTANFLQAKKRNAREYWNLLKGIPRLFNARLS